MEDARESVGLQKSGVPLLRRRVWFILIFMVMFLNYSAMRIRPSKFPSRFVTFFPNSWHSSVLRLVDVYVTEHKL